MLELASRRLGREDEAVDELARCAAGGDEAAFDMLVRRCYRRIYRWALVRVGDPDEAEDVTQEVLVRLYRHLPSWEGRGRFTTWLYGVTRNVAVSHAIRIRRRERNERDEPGVGPGASHRADAEVEERLFGRVHAQDVLGGLDRLLLRLPDRQRELFDLIDLQGFAPTEVAEMLNMNAGTVRVHLFRARRRIRAWILERDPDFGRGRKR